MKLDVLGWFCCYAVHIKFCCDFTYLCCYDAVYVFIEIGFVVLAIQVFRREVNKGRSIG